jgi:gentisate 1,2-dioxygenase
MHDTAALQPTNANPRQQFYDRIAKDHLTPLWEVLSGLVPKHPNSPALPAAGPVGDHAIAVRRIAADSPG